MQARRSELARTQCPREPLCSPDCCPACELTGGLTGGLTDLHGGPTGRPGGWPTRLPPSGLLVGGPTGLFDGWPIGLPGGGPCSALTWHRGGTANADSIVPVIANAAVAGTSTTAASETIFFFDVLPSIATAPH